jgi:hypothetical protein
MVSCQRRDVMGRSGGLRGGGGGVSGRELTPEEVSGLVGGVDPAVAAELYPVGSSLIVGAGPDAVTYIVSSYEMLPNGTVRPLLLQISGPGAASATRAVSSATLAGIEQPIRLVSITTD